MNKTFHVGYITLDESFTPEDEAVWQWLENHDRFLPERIDITEENLSTTGIDIFWIHLPDEHSYQRWSKNPDNLKVFQTLLEEGKGILLTGYAALIPNEAGLESRKPEIRKVTIKDDWMFDQRGLQSWREHPVFKNLFGGAYFWDAFEDHTLSQIGYFGDNFPNEGKVVAVEKSFVRIHADSRLMIEHESGKSKILSIGAFVHFSPENRHETNLRQLIENSLAYLGSTWARGTASYWEPHLYTPSVLEVSTSQITPALKRKWTELPESGLLIEQKSPGNNEFDLAGRRALVMGKEIGGIDELWVHPFRLLRDYEAGLAAGDSIAWLKHMNCRIEIRPESLTRYYQTPTGEVKEILFPSIEKAGAIVHYEFNGTREMQLAIRFRCDLRWMWPYDEFALGEVQYGYDDKLNALHVSDKTGDFACIFGGDIKPDHHLEGAFESIRWDGQFKGRESSQNQIYHASLFTLNQDNAFSLQMTLAGTNQGGSEALSEYRNLLRHPLEEYERSVQHYKNLLNNSVIVEGPDKEFNDLWKWTLVGSDRFIVHTPDLGTALVAGYATTARGWDGGHTINGRPGYGWYFGRDAAWSAFALDDYGDFETVRQQLEFFQKFQHNSGKIFHELSTSGVVHYDAADATPLYIILAAHYLRASGDLTFIKQSWPHLKLAADFLYSTDTDGDGLIENTNVGHGWVEGGSLWGAHTTLYLAALWAQTLKDMADISEFLKKDELRDNYYQDYKKIRHILNTDFWNERDSFFYYGKWKNGSYNREKTVLPAVVMYYDLLDDEKVQPVLEEYASNGFTSDWGVRILSSESPRFNPRGYHYGSVWPLFTGWTALAEYQYGRSVQGFSHIWNNLNIKNNWALGFVEEVMDGSVYRPQGVCPHQCWSETNILHPGIAGMIGWKPFAMENRIHWKPQFPAHWKSVTVRNLRIGKSRIDLHITRSKNQTHHEFILQKGKAKTIHFYPECLPGMTIDAVTMDGIPVSLPSEIYRGSLKQPISFELKKTVKIVVKHQNGIQMAPMLPKPEPNSPSQGYRIIDTQFQNGIFFVDLEGRANSRAIFSLRLFDQKIMRINGGKIQNVSPGGLVTFEVPFPYSDKPILKKRVSVTFMKE